MGRALKKLVWLALVLGALAGGAYFAAGRYAHIFPKLRSVQKKAGAERPAELDEEATRWDFETEEKRAEYNRGLIEGLKDALRPPEEDGGK